MRPYLTFCAQKQKIKLKRQKRGKTNNIQRFLLFFDRDPRERMFTLIITKI